MRALQAGEEGVRMHAELSFSNSLFSIESIFSNYFLDSVDYAKMRHFGEIQIVLRIA